jgi:hypothetical protein
MVTRRDFLKTAALAGSAAIFNARKLRARTLETSFFGLNDFVENHPDAVFVLRTAVDAKTNTVAIRDVGYQLGKTLFVAKPGPLNAYPVDGIVNIKPNITSWVWDKAPIETTMGIQTDPYFVEGIVAGLNDLTIPSAHVYIREANYVAQQADGTWYKDMAQRSGVNLQEMKPISQLTPADIQWVDVPNGTWYRRIPYLWPTNSPGSCLINIAKLKSHSMGMTLCCKNLQGANASPYVRHCTAWGTDISGVNTSDVVTDAFTTIKSNYDRHKGSIPRWTTLDGDAGAGSAGGLWMETHASRCLDNNAVLSPLLNIIEGVYGREGPFVSGPSPSGYGIDVMANVVIFGMNARHVDLVGIYLAGHEPGNFGLYHVALEQGLSNYLNPKDVPLYEWKLDGSATLTPLEHFARTSLRTPYLPQPGEETYHMVNQPYDYTATAVRQEDHAFTEPDAFALFQNFPNPFNPTTSIQYHLPRSGNVRLEIVDIQGQVVDVLVDGYMSAGDHLQVWNSAQKASGTYLYRLLFGGLQKTKSMVLLK